MLLYIIYLYIYIFILLSYSLYIIIQKQLINSIKQSEEQFQKQKNSFRYYISIYNTFSNLSIIPIFYNKCINILIIFMHNMKIEM